VEEGGDYRRGSIFGEGVRFWRWGSFLEANFGGEAKPKTKNQKPKTPNNNLHSISNSAKRPIHKN
jgi:hypothetical protein